MRKGPGISYDKENINNTISNQGYYGRISGSCFTIATHHVTLVTNPVISHEWEKDGISYDKGNINKLMNIWIDTLQTYKVDW